MKYLLITLFVFVSVSVSAQTLHTIMMCNKSDRTLARGNEGEAREMGILIPSLASKLGYRNNLIVHSGQDFTCAILNKEIDNLKVGEGDIIIFYYASHGVNWNDSEWPHMAFNDRQYGELAVYNTLRQRFPQAKLILCIAACCNMDEEGLARQKRTYGNLDPKLVKELFTGFEGHRSYIASSSIRGQYSWVWVAGNRPGHIFGIALRDATASACSGDLRPEWDYVFESAKSKTLQNSGQKQMPQYEKNRW